MINDERIEKIDNSISNAKRFISAGKEWKKILKDGYISNSKEGGSAKRASLDLTRSLANPRKP